MKRGLHGIPSDLKKSYQQKFKFNFLYLNQRKEEFYQQILRFLFLEVHNLCKFFQSIFIEIIAGTF